MKYLLLEGKADLYEHFLSSTANATLVAITDDFHFKIRTLEGPTLLLRHVSTHGHATNHGELCDAFYALMLSHRPGGYSSRTPLNNSSPIPSTPTLHWHLASRSCINHHRNSKVTYLRLESAALLRSFAAQAIAVGNLERLQGMAAPANLVHRIEQLDQQLVGAEPQQHAAIMEVFLSGLAQELRQLLGQPKTRDANAANHVAMALEWMLARLSAPISLPELADALALTPRTVQACFKKQLAISPMRWLKLARFSQLRQQLWDPVQARRSLPQVMAECGLSDTSLNRRGFGEVYGISPGEQQRQRRALTGGGQSVMHDSLHRMFDGLNAAIDYLEDLKNSPGTTGQYRVSVTVTPSLQAAVQPIDQQSA